MKNLLTFFVFLCLSCGTETTAPQDPPPVQPTAEFEVQGMDRQDESFPPEAIDQSDSHSVRHSAAEPAIHQGARQTSGRRYTGSVLDNENGEMPYASEQREQPPGPDSSKPGAALPHQPQHDQEQLQHDQEQPQHDQEQPQHDQEQPQESEREPEDSAQSVAIGNPETGPKPKGSMKLWIADAAVDHLTQVVLDLAVIQVIPEDQNLAVLEFAIDVSFDLLQYQGGDQLLLLDEKLPVGHYREVRLILHQQPQVELGDGSWKDVALEDSVQPLTINSLTAFEVVENQTAEFVMHVPLWNHLQTVDSQFVLVPQYELIAAGSFGSIAILGLAQEVMAVCVQPGGLSDLPGLANLPLVGDYNCQQARGRVLLGSGAPVLPYLAPGSYLIDLYIAPTLYLRIPYLTTVVAGAETIVEL